MGAENTMRVVGSCMTSSEYSGAIGGASGPAGSTNVVMEHQPSVYIPPHCVRLCKPKTLGITMKIVMVAATVPKKIFQYFTSAHPNDDS